jgi:dGTPase
MTLEGCVVRLADTISYLGRDIEDAIRLKIIERSELPSDITSVIGNTNGTIVYKLVTDIIACSFEKDYIAYSEEISVAISRLKKFNYQRIYTSRKAKEHLKHIREIYCLLFEKYLSDLKTGNEISPVFSDYVKSMDETYVSTSSYPEIVRDFIAGMTDNYFLRQAPESLRPMPMSFS